MRNYLPWVEAGVAVGSLIVLATVTWNISYTELGVIFLSLLLRLLRAVTAKLATMGIALELTIGSMRESMRLI